MNDDCIPERLRAACQRHGFDVPSERSKAPRLDRFNIDGRLWITNGYTMLATQEVADGAVHPRQADLEQIFPVWAAKSEEWRPVTCVVTEGASTGLWSDLLGVLVPTAAIALVNEVLRNARWSVMGAADPVRARCRGSLVAVVMPCATREPPGWPRPTSTQIADSLLADVIEGEGHLTASNAHRLIVRAIESERRAAQGPV